jgi:hypothetical protein
MRSLGQELSGLGLGLDRSGFCLVPRGRIKSFGFQMIVVPVKSSDTRRSSVFFSNYVTIEDVLNKLIG